MHRGYRDRASGIEGQIPGHEVRIDGDYVVIGAEGEVAARVDRVPGGYDVRVGRRHLRASSRLALRRDPALAAPATTRLSRCRSSARDCAIASRIAGTQVDVQVLPRRAAELLRLMPHKAPPDTSRFLLSPMPGLLAEVAVKPGQEVKAGERLVVIEAMKMQNVILAERDAVVAELLAQEGESLAVDQPVIRFEQPGAKA